jgi:sulfur carrier protein
MPSSASAEVASITVNGAVRALPSDIVTVAHLVRDMGIDGRRIAVERNGTIVPRSRYAETELSAGDRLEIVGAVGGG